MATLECEVFYCEKRRPKTGWGEDRYPYRLMGSDSCWKTIDEVEKVLLAPGWQWDGAGPAEAAPPGGGAAAAELSDEDYVSDDESFLPPQTSWMSLERGWVFDAADMPIDEENWCYAPFYPPHRSGSPEETVETFVRWRRQVRVQTFGGTPEALSAAAGAAAGWQIDPPFCPNYRIDKADEVGEQIVRAVARASFRAGEWSTAQLVALKRQCLLKLVDGNIKEREVKRGLEALLKHFHESQKGIGGHLVDFFTGGEQEIDEGELAARLAEVEAQFPLQERDAYAVLAMRRFNPTWVCEVLGEPHELCPLRQVFCQNPGCGLRMSAMFQEDHDKACPHKRLKCERCGEEVSREAMDEHVLLTCPERDALCPFRMMGCVAEVRHYDLEEHLRENTMPHADMMGGTIVSQKAEFRKLSTHLAQLDSQIHRQKESLEQVQRSRQGLQKRTETLELREAAFESKTKGELWRVQNDAFVDSKRKADAVMHEARRQLDGLRKEVAKIGGGDLQALKRDVESIRAKLR